MGGNTIDALAKKVPQRAIRALDNLPRVVTYCFADVDFDTDSVQEIQLPLNRRAKLLSVEVYGVTEIFTDDTTEARVDVGDGSDADAYALTDDFGTLDVVAALSFSDEDANLTAGPLGRVVPAGAEITVTYVAPTGGTPTGIANVALVFYLFE